MNIENKKQFTTFLLAIGLGLVAAFLTSQYIKNNVNQQTQALAKEYEKRNSGLIQDIEGLKQGQQQLAEQQAELARQPRGQAAPAPAQPAVQVTAFAVKTPFGKRALTILIDSLSAVGGLINPGDFVDILAQLNVPQSEENSAATSKVTTVLFQNVQVLAIGTNFESVGMPPPYQGQQGAGSLYVTLAVSPEEAGLLTFAQTNGKLQMTLRAPAEKDTKPLEIASWEALADFVKEKQGTQLSVPKNKRKVDMIDGKKAKSGDDEVKPFIQIFRGGKEL